MPLSAGTRLGAYEILALLGTGGMGEVYRARDTRLKREVAIKVLPDAFSQDPDRLARFQREAQLLATLNHSNIAQIYGFEEGALILELVEGPTLAELSVAPMPLTEALQIARQIAEALEAAHERGIIHRDLKPANIKLRPDGTVKVLDFGLAKAIASDIDADSSNSPTLTAVATRAGVIFGTAAYMSPEQARGKPVDKRTDIWAFGCVLYELVTARRAFAGNTVSDTIAAVLEREPDWRALPVSAPARFRHLLQRCLNKDPKRRLRDIGDAHTDLEEILAGGAVRGSSELSRTHAHAGRRSVALVAVLTLAVGATAGWVSRSSWWQDADSVRGPAGFKTSEVRFEITTPPTTDPVSLAISPDGQKLVFVAISDGRSLLWLRSLDAVASRPLPETDDATFPFWSPDNRSVGFFATGQLKRLDLATGAVQSLAAASGGRGGAWSTDGTILFTAGPGNNPILRMTATGGEPVVVVPQGRFPQLLPDGRHFIYFVPQAFTPESRGIWVARLDGTDRRRLVEADTAGAYASSGHLLFVRQGTLFAQGFDPSTLALGEDQFPVAGGVAVVEPPLLAALSTSAAGPVVYRTGSAGGLRQVAWFDRSGKQLERVGNPTSNIRSPALSPDGTRLAFHRSVNGNTDIWLLDVRRGVLSRFTSSNEGDFYPLWSPDGGRLVFGTNRDLFEKPAIGAGAEKVLLKTSTSKNPTSWSRDGRFVLYFIAIAEPSPNTDIWALPMQGDRKPFPVAETSFDERDGQFSPDGKWIAFQSNESGRLEVFIQPFPGPGTRMQISSNGGGMARWRDDGGELFYIGLDDQFMAVPLRLGSDTIEAGTPTPLFRTHVGGAQQSNSLAQYVVSRDGQRFLMNTLAEEEASPITVILNWKARP
jgi:Tol biopolymer transport system component